MKEIMNQITPIRDTYQDRVEKIVIECDCSAHLLQIVSDLEYMHTTQGIRYRQDICLAMFGFGTYRRRPTLRRKLGVIWHYIKTGEMHRDQITMQAEEAIKLRNFLNSVLVSPDIPRYNLEEIITTPSDPFSTENMD